MNSPPPVFVFLRLKGAMEREKENEKESGVIKDSPDSPEPFNKKPRLSLEDLQPQEKSKGILSINNINPACLLSPHRRHAPVPWK